MREGERQQRSKEFGIKLAKALRQRAGEASSEHDLDARYVVLGAADYLRDAAEAQINPPLDDANLGPENRLN